MINNPDMLGPFDLSELEDDIREVMRELFADVAAGKPTRGAGTPLVRLGQGDKRIDYTPSLAEARGGTTPCAPQPHGSGQRWWRGVLPRLRRLWKGIR